MGLFTVVRIFTLTIIFNTILPTGDVYSDILLMFQTLNFQNTDSIEMSGCRSCFGKSEEDLYPTLNDCETCLTINYDFECGGYLTSMNKFHETESRKSCKNQKWGVNGYGNLIEGECRNNHFCCFETHNNNLKIENNDEDKMKSLRIHPRFLVKCDNYYVNKYVSDNGFYDTCLLAGKAKGEYCQEDIAYKNIEEIKNFLKENNKNFTKNKFHRYGIKIPLKQ